MCNICNQTICCCHPSVTNNNINSEQAGRDGLSAKRIMELNGKLPPNSSDAQFIEAITGPPGPPGINGGGVYLETEW